MDKEQKKVVVFSFYAPQEDWTDVQDSLNRKAEKDYYKKIKSLIEQATSEKTPMSLPKVKTEFKKVQEDFNCKKFPHLKDLLVNLKILQGEWQPSVSLARAMRYDNRTIDEYHLLYQPKRGGLHSKQYVESLKGIIEAASPGTKVSLDDIDIGAGHNYQKIYTALLNYFADYQKDHKDERETTRYFVHVTAGSQAARMCLFLLAQERWIPAETIQLSKGKPQLDATDDDTPSNTDRANDKRPPNTGYVRTLTALVDSEEFLRSRAEILNAHEDNQSFLKEHIKTQNKQYNKMIGELEEVVLRTADPILILGPTGAGKSHLAKQIHALKKKEGLLEGEFVSLNCATIPQNELGISELFGHVEGTFTGALHDRKGTLMCANGGLLFLDEIGCLSLENQKRLLTFLDTGKFMPLGAEEEKEAFFQLICATNANLEEEVKKGNFRRDLLERIRTWQFTLPGLDDRKEDISPNIDPLLEDYVKERKEIQKKIEKFPTVNKITFDGQPRQKFLDYVKKVNLTGNFRELRRMIWRMATFARNSQITMDVVENEKKRHQQERTALEELVSETRSANQTTVTAKDVLKALVSNKKQLDALKPIDRVRLEFFIDQCREARTAADVGRALNGNTTTGPNTVFNHFINEKEFKAFDLSFEKIHATWQKLGSQT